MQADKVNVCTVHAALLRSPSDDTQTVNIVNKYICL